MTFLNPAAGGGSNLQTATSSIITAVASPVSLTSTDNNNPRGILSTVKGGLVKLPAANTGGFTPGPVSFPLMINPQSYPVRLYNNGTAGTDAMLEAVLAPGSIVQPQLIANTSQTINGFTTSAAAGLWNKQNLNGVATIKALQHILPGSTPPSAVTGTFTNGTSQGVCWLTGTLGIWVFLDSSLNVRAVPFQLSPDGVTNQVLGANTNIASAGGNTFANPTVSPCGNGTQVVISWFDSTNTKNDFVVVTVTAATLPSPPTIGTIGTLVDDTSLATAGTRIVSGAGFLSQDFGTANQWFVGPTGATNTNRQRAYFLTVTTNTSVIAISATADFDSGSTGVAAGLLYPGVSTSANNYLCLGNGSKIFLLNYNAGAISATWSTTIGWGGFTNYVRLDVLDLAQGLILIHTSLGGGGTSNWHGYSYVYRLNLATGAIIEGEKLGQIYSDAFPGNIGSGFYSPTLPTTLYFGDGEYLYFPDSSMTLYTDYKTLWKSGTQNTTTVGAPPAVLSQTYYAAISQKLELTDSTILTIGCHLPTRRAALAYTAPNDSVVRIAFMEFPKR